VQRGSFLAGILAGAAAPAIVRASSLMKIWVPPRGIARVGDLVWDASLPLVDGAVHYAVDLGRPGGDFTAEGWYRLNADGRIEWIDWKTVYK